MVLNKDDNTVWWEGMNKTPPANAEDWQGRPWNGETSTEKGAHPNSRFTAPAKNCPCISPEFDNPQGVPISAIIFGGRRAKTAPLVYQSRSWQHGVFVGSIMASETTAAATGAVGVLRGYEPYPTDINLEGTDVSLETLTGLLGVDKALWMEDVQNIEEFYKDFGDKLPPAMREELETLKKNLQ